MTWAVPLKRQGGAGQQQVGKEIVGSCTLRGRPCVFLGGGISSFGASALRDNIVMATISDPTGDSNGGAWGGVGGRQEGRHAGGDSARVSGGTAGRSPILNGCVRQTVPARKRASKQAGGGSGRGSERGSERGLQRQRAHFRDSAAREAAPIVLFLDGSLCACRWMWFTG